MNKQQETGNGQIDNCDFNLILLLISYNFVLKINIIQLTNYLAKISLPYSIR